MPEFLHSAPGHYRDQLRLHSRSRRQLADILRCFFGSDGCFKSWAPGTEAQSQEGCPPPRSASPSPLATGWPRPFKGSQSQGSLCFSRPSAAPAEQTWPMLYGRCGPSGALWPGGWAIGRRWDSTRRAGPASPGQPEARAPPLRPARGVHGFWGRRRWPWVAPWDYTTRRGGTCAPRTSAQSARPHR